MPVPYPGPLLYPGSDLFPGQLLIPDTIVTDLDLWIQVGEDPLQYVIELRKQGRIGPPAAWCGPVLIPSVPVNPLPLM